MRAADEDVCIIIGVDADGTLRPGIYKGGNMDASWAKQPAEWLRRNVGVLLSEAREVAAARDEHRREVDALLSEAREARLRAQSAVAVAV